MTSKRAEAEKVEAYTRALMEAARSEGRANADLVQWQHARKFSPEVLETLAAMQREDDLDLVSQVAKQYKEYLDAEDKTVSVTVTTAVPLDDDLRGKVRARPRPTSRLPCTLWSASTPASLAASCSRRAASAMTLPSAPSSQTSVRRSPLLSSEVRNNVRLHQLCRDHGYAA